MNPSRPLIQAVLGQRSGCGQILRGFWAGRFRDAKTDWAAKEQDRARLPTTINRLLRKQSYPPDKAEAAPCRGSTVPVLQQAAVIGCGRDVRHVLT